MTEPDVVCIAFTFTFVDPSCLVTPVLAGGGGVMVWGMFSWDTLGP